MFPGDLLLVQSFLGGFVLLKIFNHYLVTGREWTHVGNDVCMVFYGKITILIVLVFD